MNSTTSASPIAKLEKLTIDDDRNLIGIEDHQIYGKLDNLTITFPNPIIEGKRTTYQIKSIKAIELHDGILTVQVKGCPPEKYPQYVAVKAPTAGEDIGVSSEEIPEPVDRMSLILEDIDSKLLGLRLGSGGLDTTPFYDDSGDGIYGYFSRDYSEIYFCNGTTYSAFHCPFDTVDKVTKNEGESITVYFKDKTAKAFNRWEETDDPPNEVTSDYDGSLTSIEEMIRNVLGSSKVDKCLYTSDIDHKIYFDWELLGMGYKGKQEFQSAGDLTTLCQILEQRTEYVEKGRLKHHRINRDRANHVLIKIAQDNRKNPFLDMISQVEPDEKYRIEAFLRDVGIVSGLTNADNNEYYVENVSRALFLAIIERQLVNDNERAIRFVPIIIGEQGKGKSLICKKLGLIDFYKESVESIDDVKKYVEGLDGGCIIAEIAEATQFVQGKENAYKAWFGDNTYNFRKSYGKESMTFQKRFLEIITTNDGQILTDITGNTRYFPIFLREEKPDVPIQEHDLGMMCKYYADALKRYKAGERWYDVVDTADFQAVADLVRSGVTRDVEGLPELVEYIKGFCPEEGNIIVNSEIRDYLNGQPYDTKHIEKLVRLWGKTANRYGFAKLPEGYQVKDGLTWKHVRGYQRIAL